MSAGIEQLVKRFEDGGMTRRELVLALSALVVASRSASGAAAGSGAAAQPAAAPIPVTTMNHVTLTVADVQRSVEFYQRVLGLPLVTTQGTERDWNAAAVPVLGIGDGPQFIAFSRAIGRTSTTTASAWRTSTPPKSWRASPSMASRRACGCAPTPTRRPRS